MELKDNEFRCYGCKGVFEKGWSDTEAMAEFNAAEYPMQPNEELIELCDDCHKHFLALMRNEGGVE